MSQATLESNYNFFLEVDLSRYKGEWVAIDNNVIVSHGKNIKEVVEEAKIRGNKKFLLVKVPSGETMIF